MTNNLEEQIQRIVASMENQESQDNPQPPHEDIQDIYVLIVRESEEDQIQVVESSPTPTTTQQDSFLSAYLSKITTGYTIRHVAAWQSLTSNHHIPISNHTSNR
jgi:hypothetical protein